MLNFPMKQLAHHNSDKKQSTKKLYNNHSTCDQSPSHTEWNNVQFVLTIKAIIQDGIKFEKNLSMCIFYFFKWLKTFFFNNKIKDKNTI